MQHDGGRHCAAWILPTSRLMRCRAAACAAVMSDIPAACRGLPIVRALLPVLAVCLCLCARPLPRHCSHRRYPIATLRSTSRSLCAPAHRCAAQQVVDGRPGDLHAWRSTPPCRHWVPATARPPPPTATQRPAACVKRLDALTMLPWRRIVLRNCPPHAGGVACCQRGEERGPHFEQASRDGRATFYLHHHLEQADHGPVRAADLFERGCVSLGGGWTPPPLVGFPPRPLSPAIPFESRAPRNAASNSEGTFTYHWAPLGKWALRRRWQSSTALPPITVV